MAGMKYYARKGAIRDETGKYSGPVRPKLFDDSGYVRPDAHQIGTAGAYSAEDVSSSPSSPQAQRNPDQLHLYLEFAPTEEHLKAAYRSNRRRNSDPKVVRSLEAAKNARAALERGDYTEVAAAMERFRLLTEPVTEQITEADFDGATHYTTPSFVKKIKRTYGLETPSVGIIVPSSKWKEDTEEKTGPAQGLVQKTGSPDWSDGLNWNPKSFSRKPYDRTGVSIITDKYAKLDGGKAHESMKEHESLHAVYLLYAKEYGPIMYKGVDELYVIPNIERTIVSELSSYRTDNPPIRGSIRDKIKDERMHADATEMRDILWNLRKGALKREYIPMYRTNILRGCLSMKDGERLDSAMQIMSSRIDAAVDAINYMQDAGVPEPEITKRLLTVGSTKKEAERGEYHSPLEDVIAWGKRTEKEVAARKYAQK